MIMPPNPIDLKRNIQMNQTKPQRVRVAEYIADNAKCTAIQIAAALNISDTAVANELNALRTEGVIDCERSGTPPSLRYFAKANGAELLYVAENGTVGSFDLPDGIQPGSRKAQVWHALRGGKRMSTCQLSDTLRLKPKTIGSTVLEMFKSGLIERTKYYDNVWTYHHPARQTIRHQHEGGKNTGSDGSVSSPGTPPAAAVAVPKPAPAAAAPSPVTAPVAADDPDDAMPAPDTALLASANRMLIERLEGVAHALRGCGLPKLRDVTGRQDLQPAVAALSGAYQVAIADLADARAMVDRLDAVLRTHADNTAEKLGQRPASHYLIARGDNLSPLYTSSLAEARTLASTAARDHGRRADVFAMVPVGAAVPAGVEWVEA